MDRILYALTVLVVVILLPMLPAYVLFRFLDSRAEIRRTMAGTSVKLGGAFAGYVILVWMINSQVFPAIRTFFNPYEDWEIRGEIVLKQEDVHRINELFKEIQVREVPPTIRPDISANNDKLILYAKVKVFRDESGKVHFPDLSISLKDYQTRTISLNNGETYGGQYVKARILNKEVFLESPIALQKFVETGQTQVPTFVPASEIPNYHAPTSLNEH